MVNNKIWKKFTKLEKEMIELEKTKYISSHRYKNAEYLNQELFLKWKIKTKSLINKIYGENSDYYKDFIKAEKTSRFLTNFDIFKKLKPIFLASKEDFEDEHEISSLDKKILQNIKELSNLNEELKKNIKIEKNINNNQKIILEQLSYEIDNAINKYPIDNQTIQRLYETLIGKLILYQKELKNIDSFKIKKTLKKIYEKIYNLNKLLDTISNIGSKIKDFLDLLPF